MLNRSGHDMLATTCSAAVGAARAAVSERRVAAHQSRLLIDVIDPDLQDRTPGPDAGLLRFIWSEIQSLRGCSESISVPPSVSLARRWGVLQAFCKGARLPFGEMQGSAGFSAQPLHRFTQRLGRSGDIRQSKRA